MKSSVPHAFVPLADVDALTDWAATPLGPVHLWPSALRTAAVICVSAPNPVSVWWGRDHLLIFNEAFRTLFGAAATASVRLGHPAGDSLGERANVFAPLVTHVTKTGKGTTLADRQWLVLRDGLWEERYFNYAFSALGDSAPFDAESARPVAQGALVVGIETTDRVIRDRRLATLRRIGLVGLGAAHGFGSPPSEAVSAATTARPAGQSQAPLWRRPRPGRVAPPEGARGSDGSPRTYSMGRRPASELCVEGLSRLDGNDTPFALVYLLDEKGLVASPVASFGFDEPHAAAAQRLDVPSDALGWPFAEVTRNLRSYLVSDVAARLGAGLQGQWPAIPPLALVYPIVASTLAGTRAHAGFLVLGVSALRPFDDGYRRFADLTALELTRIVDLSIEARGPSWAQTIGERLDDSAPSPSSVPPMAASDLYAPAPATDGMGADLRRRAIGAGGRRPRILVADDNPATARYIGLMLEKSCDVTTVSDGVEALVAAQANRPDLILSDIQMPALDGFELLQALRRDRALSDIPFILISAYGGEKATLESLEAGADDFITIPFSARELLTRVRSVLELVRLRAEVQRGQSIGEALRREQEASRLKDEFLATVSHELRTPLTAILGWSRILRGDNLEPAKKIRAVETIERNAVIQAHIVDDLLDVSRIIAGKMQLDIQRVDVGPLFEIAIESVRAALEAKSISIHTRIDPLAGKIAVDPNRFIQIAWNLLANAAKFTAKGGKIELSACRVDSNVEIRVSDDGQGISPDFLPFVFDRFRQADGSTTRKHGGLGLGLSIVRHLVELHGGSVRAFSNGCGCGATFSVTLPLPSAVDELTAATTARETSDDANVAFPAAVELQDLRALVLQDEKDASSVV